MSIKVMITDDHKMLREGIKQLIEFDPEITVVDQAACGTECIEKFPEVKPDIVLLDINLPDMTGIRVLKELKKKSRRSKVLMLTVHNETEYLMESLDNNADGYILKEADSTELIKAIKAVYRGERYIQSDLIPSLNARLIQKDTEYDMVRELTKREKQILISIAEGKSNADIGADLDISERTVKNHITNLFKKIGVKDRTQAAVFAIRNNLVNV
ncbi:MAG: response regulator transcription factor [Lachnospiraceae bacterium]|nr:response regulator transcription factor [Lachnospiraceae bacterium]